MHQQQLTITLLGTGTSTGIPVIGCQCPVCRSSHPHNQRTRCSLLLSDGQHNILIDTSTDFRQQALREDIRHINAVFYTHSHADHLHGIDDLRIFNMYSRQPIPLYGSAETLGRIERSFRYIFDHGEHSSYVPQLDLFPIDAPVVIGNLEMIPVPLRHGPNASTGYRCGPIAYLTDCNAIPDESYPLLENLELLIIDALRFKPHPTHFNISEAVKIAQRIGARQTLLTHLSHDVDHLRDNAALPESVSFAFDGLQLSFPMPTTSQETEIEE